MKEVIRKEGGPQGVAAKPLNWGLYSSREWVWELKKRKK